MIPGADPKAAVQQIADELKEKFDEMGMGKVSEFTDGLDSIKDKLQDGPGQIIDAVKKQFTAMTEKIQSYIDDPSQLAPSGGALAAVAAWYASQVAEKLKKVKDMFMEFLETIKKLAGGALESLKSVGTTIKDAMSKLQDSLTQLAKLPATVTGLADKAGGPDDIAKIDMGPLNKCTDTSGVNGPLDSIAGLKGSIGGAVDPIKELAGKLMDFLSQIPDMIKGCFQPGAPLCCLEGMIMSNAPPAVAELMGKVDSLKEIDMGGLTDMLEKVSDKVGNMDIDAVKAPIENFGSFAKGKVDALGKVVSGAKMASGGGMPGGVL